MNVRELVQLIAKAALMPNAGLEVAGADADNFTSMLTLRADLRCEDFTSLSANYELADGIRDANTALCRWEEAEREMLDCIGDEE